MVGTKPLPDLNAEQILLIQILGTNLGEILREMHIFSPKKCIWKCNLRNGSDLVLTSMCLKRYAHTSVTDVKSSPQGPRVTHANIHKILLNSPLNIGGSYI